MKLARLFVVVFVVSLTLPSCFLFRSSHERCPAYGQEVEEKGNLEDLAQDVEETGESEIL